MRFLLILASLPLAAQVHVVFVQQGAEILKAAGGKRIKGIGIAAVTAKNLGTAITVQADDIYVAAAKVRISYIAPILAGPILDKHAATSWPQITLDLSGIVSGGIGLAGISKAIKMSNGWALGFSAIPIVIAVGQKFFTSQLPHPDLVKEHLLTGSWKLEAGESIPSGQLIMFRYHGDWDPREIDIGGLVAAQPVTPDTAPKGQQKNGGVSESLPQAPRDAVAAWVGTQPEFSALPLINAASALWRF